MTAALPNSKGDINSLFMWSLNQLDTPVQKFLDHGDVISEFWWINKGVSASNMVRIKTSWIAHIKIATRYTIFFSFFSILQISLSNDQTLKCWQINSSPSSCGSEALNETFFDAQDTLTKMGDVFDTMSSALPIVEEAFEVVEEDRTVTRKKERRFKPQEVKFKMSCGQELNNLSKIKLKHLQLKKVSKQYCRLFAQFQLKDLGARRLHIKINFHRDVWPSSPLPQVSFSQGCDLERPLRNQIVKALKNTANYHIRESQPCLEPCVRHLDFLVYCLERDGYISERMLRSHLHMSKNWFSGYRKRKKELAFQEVAWSVRWGRCLRANSLHWLA